MAPTTYHQFPSKEMPSRRRGLYATRSAPMPEKTRFLAQHTTASLAALFAQAEQGKTVALVPVGSVEPHGPHLPLSTDTVIGEATAARAAEKLTERGITALIGPSVPYGVTDFAEGFAGAISISAAALTGFLRALVDAYLKAGFAHVCFINNHLEPAHDAAVRAASEGYEKGRVSIASPLTRRFARTLSAEFKSGACHAGRYETSIVLAAAPETVDQAAAALLPGLTTSLSDGIRKGQTSFRAMGLEAAYTGAPAEATAEEGREMVERLADMVVAEVEEAILGRGA